MLVNLPSQHPNRYVADNGHSLDEGLGANIQAMTSVLCPHRKNSRLTINLCLSCLASKTDA